jgi:hypothetical protein
VPCCAPEKRKECLPHPLGQFEIGGVELSCFGGKTNVERTRPALVWLEECYVAQHLRGLFTFRFPSPHSPSCLAARMRSDRSQAEMAAPKMRRTDSRIG